MRPPYCGTQRPAARPLKEKEIAVRCSVPASRGGAS